MARYTALTDGCLGTRYVRVGEVFDLDGSAPGWAVLLKPAEKKPAEKKPTEKKPTPKSSEKAGE